jgi:predicted metalloprotease
MQWEGGAESSNVEDRRGMGTPLAIGGGATGLLALIIYLVTGFNFGGGGGMGGGGGQQATAPPDDRTRHFVSVVLNYTEEVWKDQFNKRENGYGRRYVEPKLVLFTSGVRTGCGNAPSSVGPFYCPADQTVYLDPSFFDELQQRLGGSKAEFSQAYVIAHEVGHHVQNLLGYSERVDAHRGRRDEKQYSVRLELMADYLAGVWAFHGQKKFKFIEPGDVESAITSARAIGDDRLQKHAGGFVHPEQFTHGTSRQRVYFFKRGLDTGDAKKATLDKFFDAPMRSNGEIQDF